MTFRRGRLSDAGAAPAAGEVVERVFERAGVAIEHILSGTLDAPVPYRQDEDEWVVLLTGSARLRIGGERIELTAGDWLLLPAGVDHELEQTEPGSRWLAVFLEPEPPG